MVATICRLATEQGLDASGALTTELSVVGVANSHELRRYEQRTHASLLTVVLDDAGSGYAERTSMSVDDLDAEAIGREAVDKAVRSRGAIRVEPGQYEVVLEEYAVGDVLNYLAYMGFGALALQEDTSFLRGKLGRKIVDERISVRDDGRDPDTLPASFDYEGMPKQRVPLIERGGAAGVVYDSRTAARDGRASTGHAMPAPSTFGPFPTNLVMAAGDTPKADLARPIRRGLWVTRLHYVNVAKSERAALTGLTRDGTFLIETGEVTRPVKNLRFTESILDAWNTVGAISRERLLVEGWGGGTLAPAMRLGRFTFTGVSDV
jgi:predicted Zn-dependent protease